MNHFGQHNDEELMQEVKAGNMLAFDELYRKYSRKLYKFSYSMIKSTEDAENIIQDVFLNLWLNREKVEKTASVRYYIFTIAYNSAISFIRKKIKDSNYLEYVKTLQDLVQEPVDLQIEYKELDEKLNNIIEKLPARQKQVYMLSRVEGLKYSEIAERLNISINTVENHLSRALYHIRKKLGNYSVITVLFGYLFA